MKKNLINESKPVWLVIGVLAVATFAGPQFGLSQIRGGADCVSHTEQLVCRDLAGCTQLRYKSCKDVTGHPQTILCTNNQLDQPCFNSLLDCSSNKNAATSTCGE
jgi:hypothetical protein